MSTTCLLFFAIATPPEEAPAKAAVPHPRSTVRVEREFDRDEVRDWYTKLAASTTKRARMPATEAVPQLVALHRIIDDVPRLSSTERQRMKATIRGRIEWYGHRLRSQVIAAQRRGTRKPDTAAGGNPSLAGAQSLIDLIQRTVNPPIWDVNGGPASIGYFPTFHALVVRAPGEVHYQLGGTLDQVRRAGQ